MSNESQIDVRVAETHSIVPDAPASVTNAKGIMATARAPHGGTLSADPKGTDVVDVPLGDGVMSMTILSAIKNGFLKVDADGRYVDASPITDNAEPKDEAPQQQPEEGPEPLMWKNEAADEVTAIAEAFASEGLNPVALIGAALARPDTLPDHWKEYASSHGMSEEESTAQFHRLRAGFDDALDDFVFNNGVSIEQHSAFWQFFHEQPERISALTEALATGSTRALHKVVKRFVSGHGSGRGAAMNTEIRQGYGGQESVETVVGPNGIRTTVEVARRLGWV